MSGGYGSGGRGYDRGQGYGEEDDGQRGRPRQRPDAQPSWDEQDPRQGQPRGGRGSHRAGRGQGGGHAAGSGQPHGGRDQGYGQRDGRPDPWGQGQRQPSGAPQYPRGGPQPGRRGSAPGWQDPGGYDQGGYDQGGYDPRGTAGRRAAGGYPGGSPGRGDSGRDEGFMPGFGGGGAYDQGGRGQYPGEYQEYPGWSEDAGGRRGRSGGRGGRRGGDDWDDAGDGRRRRGPVRRLAPWVALLVILTPIVLGGLYVYNKYEDKYHPADYAGPGTGSVTVQVKSGDTASSLGPRLQQLGVVASSRAFVNAAEHTTSTTAATAPGLEPGFYRLHMHMQASLAWAALLNPKDRVQLTVTIPEGKRTSQVVSILAKDTSIPASDFQQVINDPAQLGLPSYANGKVEGYLFPATYTIVPNETALQILKAMVQRYGAEQQQANLVAEAKRLNMTPQQVIIEASMVQAEGGVVTDYPKIARVIVNRLNDNMKLQFDSVLLYGLNAYGVNVTQKQIDTPGPYNDFDHAGLPPGPIDNPGDKAIQAVLHPASGPWLFFLTKAGGHSEFSATPLQGQ